MEDRQTDRQTDRPTNLGIKAPSRSSKNQTELYILKQIQTKLSTIIKKSNTVNLGQTLLN